MATIKDVAKRANVSTTTVSHVINKTRFVAEETRERRLGGNQRAALLAKRRGSQPQGQSHQIDWSAGDQQRSGLFR